MHVLKYNETFYVVYQSKSIIKKVIESQTVQAERKKKYTQRQTLGWNKTNESYPITFVFAQWHISTSSRDLVKCQFLLPLTPSPQEALCE